MNNVALLLDKAKKALKASSDAELARKLGVTRASVSNWRTGRNMPDVVQCATLAGLTGEPLAKVLGVVGEARAISREEKTVWRKLAASVAVLVLAMSAALPGISQTQEHGASPQGTSNRHYAKCSRPAQFKAAAALIGNFLLWLRWRFKRKPTSSDYIEACI